MPKLDDTHTQLQDLEGRFNDLNSTVGSLPNVDALSGIFYVANDYGDPLLGMIAPSDLPSLPALHSNINPEATITASASFGTQPYHAFDRTNSTYWSPSTTEPGSGHWIQIELPEPDRFRKLEIYTPEGSTPGDQSSIGSFMLQASHDGTSWINLWDDPKLLIPFSDSYKGFAIFDAYPFKFYRLSFISAPIGFRLYGVNFFGSEIKTLQVMDTSRLSTFSHVTTPSITPDVGVFVVPFDRIWGDYRAEYDPVTFTWTFKNTGFFFVESHVQLENITGVPEELTLDLIIDDERHRLDFQESSSEITRYHLKGNTMIYVNAGENMHIECNIPGIGTTLVGGKLNTFLKVLQMS